jgi:hypothetical protein
MQALAQRVQTDVSSINILTHLSLLRLSTPLRPFQQHQVVHGRFPDAMTTTKLIIAQPLATTLPNT